MRRKQDEDEASAALELHFERRSDLIYDSLQSQCITLDHYSLVNYWNKSL